MVVEETHQPAVGLLLMNVICNSHVTISRGDIESIHCYRTINLHFSVIVPQLYNTMLLLCFNLSEKHLKY